MLRFPPLRHRPVIGHIKSEHRMGYNGLFWHRQGGAANAVRAAILIATSPFL
jgi:hypothetical protein